MGWILTLYSKFSFKKFFRSASERYRTVVMITLVIKKNIDELKLHISENQLVDKNKTHLKENVLQ